MNRYFKYDIKKQKLFFNIINSQKFYNIISDF